MAGNRTLASTTVVGSVCLDQRWAYCSPPKNLKREQWILIKIKTTWDHLVACMNPVVSLQPLSGLMTKRLKYMSWRYHQEKTSSRLTLESETTGNIWKTGMWLEDLEKGELCVLLLVISGCELWIRLFLTNDEELEDVRFRWQPEVPCVDDSKSWNHEVRCKGPTKNLNSSILSR